MKTRFYIEKRKDESGNLLMKECPVIMSISFSGYRVIVGTGIKIDSNGWDSDLQRLKATYPLSQAYNSWFDCLEDSASATLKALENTGERVDARSFRMLFNQMKPRFASGVFDVFYLFMDSNASRWSVATYQKVRKIYDLLREFEVNTSYRISFGSLNETFLEKFLFFCSQKKGYRQSTIHKSVNILVWFLNWATEKGYNVYREYRRFYRLMEPLKSSPQNPLFLKWDELMKIRDYVPVIRRVERVKDLFCFMCFSGVRFSELQGLLKEDISEEELIIRKKSGVQRRLPLNKHAREIYKLYENKYFLKNTAFPYMSVITMNKYLRLIGKEAGLVREVEPEDGTGIKVPLYERLTAGVAVNTFIGNALEIRVSLEVLSGFTGIQNDRRIRKIMKELAREEIRKFDLR